MSEWKVVIPFPGGTEEEASEGKGFHGILRLHDQPAATGLPADGSCVGQPLALLTHGLLSHKNAIFFRPATKMLGMDSFRWDMCGEGETPGEWNVGNYALCAEHTNYIVRYLAQRFGYRLDTMLSHSKGCTVSTTFASKFTSLNPSDGLLPPPRRMILCSGRLRMSRIHEKDDVFVPKFQEFGYAPITLQVQGQTREYRVYPEHHETQCTYPAQDMATNLPPSILVYIAHGLSDNVVPVEDAPGIANLISAHPRRQPGTVHIELFPQCDHNYRGDATNALLQSLQRWMEASQHLGYQPRPLSLPVSPSSKRGALIVIEGLDRSGKSTQVDRLVQHLQARHVKFPERSTAIGSMINEYLTRKSEINDHAVHLLFSANRWELIESILQSLQQGKTVVCDRYAFSGIAYTWAKGLSLDWCISSDAGIPIPDLTLFLDLDEKTASARAAYGDERYEKRAFQKKVRHAFYQVESFVQYAGGHWVRIDASGTPDQVWHTIQHHTDAVLTPGPSALYPLDLEAMRPALPWTREGPEKASL